MKTAIALLASSSPAVAILDLQLGREFSGEVAKALLARGIPFVVATATEDPASVAGPAFQGITNLGKPIREDRLEPTLREAIARHSRQTDEA